MMAVPLKSRCRRIADVRSRGSRDWLAQTLDKDRLKAAKLRDELEKTMTPQAERLAEDYRLRRDGGQR